jgi:hypothetical protein
MQATFGPEAQSTPTRRNLITDYLSRRQNVVNQDPAAIPEFNAHLDALADRFGLSWLESDDGSPVQQLWRSTDALATNELLNLGRAVQNLSARNARWIERQVNIVKSPNPGRRAGAIFELLAFIPQALASIMSTSDFNPDHRALPRIFANPKESQLAEITQLLFQSGSK